MSPFLGHDPVDLLGVDGAGEGAVLGAGHDEGGEPDGPHEAGEVEVEPVVLEREVHLLQRQNHEEIKENYGTFCNHKNRQ